MRSTAIKTPRREVLIQSIEPLLTVAFSDLIGPILAQRKFAYESTLFAGSFTTLTQHLAPSALLQLVQHSHAHLFSLIAFNSSPSFDTVAACPPFFLEATSRYETLRQQQLRHHLLILSHCQRTGCL